MQVRMLRDQRVQVVNHAYQGARAGSGAMIHRLYKTKKRCILPNRLQEKKESETIVSSAYQVSHASKHLRQYYDSPNMELHVPRLYALDKILEAGLCKRLPCGSSPTVVMIPSMVRKDAGRTLFLNSREAYYIHTRPRVIKRIRIYHFNIDIDTQQDTKRNIHD